MRIREIRNENFNNFILEAESFLSSTWKVTRTLRNIQPILSPLVINNVKYFLDSEKSKFSPIRFNFNVLLI